MVSPDLNLAIPRLCTHSRLASEVNELPSEVSLVLWNISIKRRGQSWIVPRSCLGVVVNEVDTRLIVVCQTRASYYDADETYQLK